MFYNYVEEEISSSNFDQKPEIDADMNVVINSGNSAKSNRRSLVTTVDATSEEAAVAVETKEKDSMPYAKVYNNQDQATSSTTIAPNAETDSYEDLMKAGIMDPTKVVRLALQNAASVASLMLTTEAMVAEKPEEKKGMHPGGQEMGGGMGGGRGGGGGGFG